jgi:ABC-type dipeptide/oligopeptide/nickel transport system permease subunit
MKKFWQKFLHNRLALLGGIVVIFLILVAVLTPVIFPYQKVVDQNLSEALHSPNSIHILGTDDLGRDVFIRILYGTRISLIVGIAVVLVGMIIGVFFGLISGYYGGWQDSFIMRLTDIFLAFPFLLLAIAIAAFLGPNLRNGIIALSFASIPSYVRLVRASVLSLKESTYVEAARVCGSTHARIIFSAPATQFIRHVAGVWNLKNLYGDISGSWFVLSRTERAASRPVMGENAL